MKTHISRAAAAFAVLALAATARAAPLITSVVPSEIAASPKKEMHVVLIRGYGIWEGSTGYDEYARRVAVFIRRDGAFEKVRTYAHGYWQGTDEQELELNIPQIPWFETPGTFEVMVKVDGVASNYYQVPVLSGSPAILKVSPTLVKISGARSDATHMISIVALNTGNPDDVSVMLGGKRIQAFTRTPGVMVAFIPEAAFQKGGTYDLTVGSTLGMSAPFRITLSTPPLKSEEKEPITTRPTIRPPRFMPRP